MSDVPDIYTNSVRLTASIYEFMLSCCLATTEADGTRSTTEIVRLRMSPQHALALNIVLTKQLRKYGERFQEIFLPEDMIASLEEDKEAQRAGE